ncbi:sulfotransferase domain-containing protein [Planctomycetales bacterium ZRK34]|nr:sulfotransferase domain-containing protein [Planctomycetales bacterium ZRK34]
MPHAIIIGAQKSGTTYLGRCLERHCEVFMLPWENPYFVDPYYQENTIDSVTKCFDDAKEGLVCVMKRPDYLSEAPVAARLANDIPDVKLIVILRNPVKRAISAYYHYMLRNCLPLASPEHGLRQILDHAYDAQRYPAASWILDYGNYGEALARYDQYFEPDRMHVIIWEQFIKDQAIHLDALCRFLDVSQRGEQLIVHHREREGIYHLTRLRWLRFFDRLGMNHATNIFRRRVRHQSLISFSHRVDNRILRPILGNKRPDISRELEARLYDYYAADITRLEVRLGINLDPWRLTPTPS